LGAASLNVEGNVPGGLVWILLFVSLSVFLFVSFSVCLSFIIMKLIYLRCGFPQGGWECSRRAGLDPDLDGLEGREGNVPEELS